MKALEILQELQYSCECTGSPDMIGIGDAIVEFESLKNRTCENCSHSSYEMKFGELEFNSCFLVSNKSECKWEKKQ